MKTSEAFRLIGLNPDWVGALRAHPEELRDFLKRYHRASARVFHSDVAANPLTKQAGLINTAWERLNGLSNEELSSAARAYADSASFSVDELIAEITRMSPVAPPDKTVIRRAHELERALGIEKTQARELEKASFRFLAATLTSGYRGYTVPDEFANAGRWLASHELRGRFFLAPFEIFREEGDKLKSGVPRLIERVIVRVGSVSRDDRLLHKVWYIKPLRRGMPDEEVLGYAWREVKLRLENLMQKPAFTSTQNAGQVIGFTNTRVSAEMRGKIDSISSWLSSSLPVSPSELISRLAGAVSRQDVYFTPEQRADKDVHTHILGLVALKTNFDHRMLEESFIYSLFGIGEIIGFP